MSACPRFSLCVWCILLVLSGASRAGVVWAAIGSEGSPALLSDGSVLRGEYLADLGVSAVDTRGRDVGTVTLFGLDEAAPGIFRGVVYVDAQDDTTVFLRLIDPVSGQAATLGPGLMRGDDFSPLLDIEHHRI